MRNARKPNQIKRNIVGERVREARRRFLPTLTQDQLSGKLAAEETQLDRVAIAKIEGGSRCVFDFEVRALASALNLDVKWLLGIDAQTLEQTRKKKQGETDRG